MTNRGKMVRRGILFVLAVLVALVALVAVGHADSVPMGCYVRPGNIIWCEG